MLHLFKGLESRRQLVLHWEKEKNWETILIKRSDAQYLKLTKDKERKESQIAKKKIPRIDNCFVRDERVETTTQESDSVINQSDEVSK